MKNFLRFGVLLLTFAFAATSCVPEEQKEEGWSVYFGFTSDALLGDYYPNEELWENDLPADYIDNNGCLVQYVPMVDAGCTVRRWSPNPDNYDNLQFTFSGFPSDIERVIGKNFTTNVYYSNNNYTFSLNSNSEVTVYKDQYGNVRLHGWIEHFKPSQPYGYGVVDVYTYYYFDIVK